MLIVYDVDERKEIEAANMFIGKNFPSVAILNGGLPKFMEKFPQHLVGTHSHVHQATAVANAHSVLHSLRSSSLAAAGAAAMGLLSPGGGHGSSAGGSGSVSGWSTHSSTAASTPGRAGSGSQQGKGIAPIGGWVPGIDRAVSAFQPIGSAYYMQADGKGSLVARAKAAAATSPTSALKRLQQRVMPDMDSLSMVSGSTRVSRAPSHASSAASQRRH